MHILSKSTYIRGTQCEKSLWLNKHRKDLRDEVSEAQQAVFDRGHSVGELAQQLFAGGVLVIPEGEFPNAGFAQKTAELIQSGVNVLYEACFLYNEVLCAVDILVKRKNKWYAYEVKSSTGVTDTYINDASLQSYIINGCNIELADLSIVFLNNSYVRQGDIDINELFTIESVYEKSKLLLSRIEEKIRRFKTVLQLEQMPKIEIGEHCSNPYKCDFWGHCWQHIPSPSVFDLTRLSSKRKFQLYGKGIVSFKDIPDDTKFTEAQNIQVQAFKQSRSFVDTSNIKRFVELLKYPLYFLDFETIMPAIPLFDGLRPYQQLCTQYSLHVQYTPKSEVQHYEFLAQNSGDPRKFFINQLLHDVGTKGDVLVYNKAFECTRLKELAEDFPQYAPAIQKVLKRIVDLMEPFQKKWYYSPEMNGSYSIKKVLPALVPELSYNKLEIANGGTAMMAFEALYYETNKSKIEQTRKALLQYCEMDTLAMVKILEKLQQL